MSTPHRPLVRAILLFYIVTFVASMPLQGASPIVIDLPEHTLLTGRFARVYGTTVAPLTNLAVFLNDRKMGETTSFPPQYGYVVFFTNDIPGDFKVTVKATNETGAVASSDPIVLHFPSNAAARFIFPTNGANLFFGEDVKIQVEAPLDHGELTAMRIDYPDILGVYQLDEEPPYELLWRAPRPGTYTFRASPWFAYAGYGESAESLTFDILPESVPYITVQPLFYGPAQPGKDFQLTVASVSRGPQRYQWLRNSVPIHGATNTTYTVESATMADDALYSVTIDNFAGRTTSEPAHVDVEGAQAGGGTVLFSNIGLQNDPRISGASTTQFIEAKLAAGPALDQMIIYRNHAQITNGQFNGGVITLSNVPPGGKAFVQVLVERNWEVFVGASRIFQITAGGEQPAALTGLESFEAGDTYYYPGLFLAIDSSTQTNVYAGFNTELKVGRRFPQSGDLTNLTFQWKKNGLLIPGATNRVLRLTNLQLNDSGWYSVLATDWQKTEEAGATITVLHPLTVTAAQNGELKLRTNPGARYTLETSADLRTWTFWKTVVADAADLTLPVTPAASGQIFYRAIAEP